MTKGGFYGYFADRDVRAVVARVSRARLEFLRRVFALPADEAGDRAWLAYAFYLGHHRLGDNADRRHRQPASLERVVELQIAPATGRPGA